MPPSSGNAPPSRSLTSPAAPLDIKPITVLDDLKAISVRSGASLFGRRVEHFGGTKVSTPGSEMYEALAQGVVDCTMVSMPDVRSFQFWQTISRTHPMRRWT